MSSVGEEQCGKEGGEAEHQLSAVEKEEQAREAVLYAAQLLKSLGPEKARIGWMLEDTLMYLDETDADDTLIQSGSPAAKAITNLRGSNLKAPGVKGVNTRANLRR